MGLRIQNRVTALTVTRGQRPESAATASTIGSSSGSPHSRDGDDLLGAATSLVLRDRVLGLRAALTSATSGATPDGAESTSRVTGILDEIRQLSLKASSGGLTEADRHQIESRISELQGQIRDLRGHAAPTVAEAPIYRQPSVTNNAVLSFGATRGAMLSAVA